MSYRLYGNVAPSLMTDEQIKYTLNDIDRDLAACEKLKPGPWNTAVRVGGSWHDDPGHNCVEIRVRGNEPLESVFHPGEVVIASGTIYNTQREVFFMASMREEFPDALQRERALLIYIRELRKKVARKKARRS